MPGPRGERGTDGPAGPQGQPGPVGERGEKGADGAAGERGERGADGKDGQYGKDGAAGKDAPAVDLDLIAAKVLPLIPLPKDGRDGINGRDGAAGERGADGVAGKDGAPGVAGKDADLSAVAEIVASMVSKEVSKAVGAIPMPRDGKDGADGKSGEDGRDGRDGIDGKDAAHLMVLDGIDPERRYQRGAWASHRGGLLYAYRVTDPMAAGADIARCGWQVVLDGIAEEAESLIDDGRTIEKTTTYTSGRQLVRKHPMLSLRDRGVYRAAGKYHQGDAVSYAGSLWIAQRDTTESPGTGHADWRLAVKRGNDGRQA